MPDSNMDNKIQNLGAQVEAGNGKISALSYLRSIMHK